MIIVLKREATDEIAQDLLRRIEEKGKRKSPPGEGGLGSS